eukprot:TRINITY_DN21339_c0_g1_i2.p1 TRINITY_DN21339_c0_g1~~TRINITY_DN21339_c0_g1_i2.p1  ORF type:complete len:293 (-),score=40.07 TRINITY_DN21339_c0_g1_i2:37-915(-)
MARASRAPLAIRRGSELVYVYDRDLAERYLWSTVDKQCDKDDVQRELLSFEGDLIEIAKGLKSDTRCNSAGVALSMLKPHIRSGLCNDIRGIIRARGFSAHPTPPGKCQRVLGDLRDALSSEGLNEELNESTTDPETNEENHSKTEYSNRIPHAGVAPIDRGTQCDLCFVKDAKDALHLAALCGTWEPMEKPEVNDVVEVDGRDKKGGDLSEGVFSADGTLPIRLYPGLRGVVKGLDEEGDCLVHFPQLSHKLVTATQCILKDDFPKLLKLTSQQSCRYDGSLSALLNAFDC